MTTNGLQLAGTFAFQLLSLATFWSLLMYGVSAVTKLRSGIVFGFLTALVVFNCIPAGTHSWEVGDTWDQLVETNGILRVVIAGVIGMLVQVGHAVLTRQQVESRRTEMDSATDRGINSDGAIPKARRMAKDDKNPYRPSMIEETTQERNR